MPDPPPRRLPLGTPVSVGILAALVLAVGVLDAATSSDLAFGAYYLVPVGWGAWIAGRRWAYALAGLALAVLAATDAVSGRAFTHPFYRGWELINHLAVLMVVVEGLARLRATLDRVKEANARLSAALSEVKELKGLLPVCAWCRKVRDDEGYWEGLEAYVASRTRATFSHGICPECRDRHFPDQAGPARETPPA